MAVYNVTVNVDGRDLQSFVKEGVLASIETGTHEDRNEIPLIKINLIVGNTVNGPTVWIQVSHYNDEGWMQIKHEGWISAEKTSLDSILGQDPISASIFEVSLPSSEIMRSLEDKAFGVTACCTAYGDGCYVRCCNGCCSDPVGCPGASCCG